MYRWNAAIETAAEVPLLIKTTRARYAELQATLKPRPTPTNFLEIVAVTLEAGCRATWPGWRPRPHRRKPDRHFWIQAGAPGAPAPTLPASDALPPASPLYCLSVRRP